jgi:flavin reductase (DIM6/NTAB) family NADH-FMN oxidoreductase RutF
MKVEPKLIHRLFYPQVPLILSAQFGGRFTGMPVVSYASVSDNPPLVAVSCKPEGFTCKLAVKAGCFSLSVLGSELAASVSLLATTSGSTSKDKLRAAGLEHSPGPALGVPVLKGAKATLECWLVKKRPIGDHLLLTGLVEAAYASNQFDELWDFGKYRPILYTGWKDGLTTYPGARRRTSRRRPRTS